MEFFYSVSKLIIKLFRICFRQSRALKFFTCLFLTQKIKRPVRFITINIRITCWAIRFSAISPYWCWRWRWKLSLKFWRNRTWKKIYASFFGHLYIYYKIKKLFSFIHMYIHHLLNSNEYREQMIQKQIQIDIWQING